MRKVAVINQKGGVGKTTTCCNVGAALASRGRSVLLIDLDPQAHLTMHLGVEPEADRPSVYQVLTENMPVDQAIVECRENLWLLPSHIDLAAAEMELVSVMGREVVLRDALAAVPRDYDYVMIDCPPSLGVLTVNGLAAVTEVLIPLQPHFLALQGVGKLLETISLVTSRINPSLSVTGVILCMYEAGTRLAGEVSADVSGFLDSFRGSDKPWANARMFETLVRRNIKLAECPSHGQTIFEYAPRSHGAADHARLAAEVDGDVDESATQDPDNQAASDGEAKADATASEPPPTAEQDDIPPLKVGSCVVTGPEDVPTPGTIERAEAPAPADDQPAVDKSADDQPAPKRRPRRKRTADSSEPAESPVTTHG